MMRALLGLVTAVALLASTLGAQATAPIFRIDHQAVVGGTYRVAYGPGLASSAALTVDPDGTRGPKNGTNVWDFQHMTGGWNGRNFMRFLRWANVNGDPDTGFLFNPTTVAPTGGWVAMAQTRPIYARFRLRPNAALTLGANSSAQMKWFIFGGPGITGSRRMIFSFDRATHYPAPGCTNDAAALGMNMTAGVSGNRAVACAPVGVWSHIQMRWCYNGAGAGCPSMAIYVNAPNEAAPTAIHTAFSADGMGGSWPAPEGWSTGLWADTVSTNSFTGTDASIDIMDFEVGNTFDPNWGTTGSTLPGPPTSPSLLRVL